MKSTELRQKRATLIRQARGLVDAAELSTRAMNAEEENQYNAIMADVEKLGAEIERIEKLEALESDLRETTSVPEQPAGRQNNADKVTMAVRRFLIAGQIGPELRALQADADAAGGYTVMPQQFINALIQAIDDQTFMRGLATVNQVTNAESLGQPYLSANPAVPTWTTELLIGSEDSTMEFGKRELTPHPLAKYIKVSRKLLRLNPSADQLVIDRLAYVFGITAENAYLNGSGANQPLGVFTASNDGIGTSRDVSTGNTTTSIQTDGLKEAKYALKGGYWRNAAWIFHRSAVKQIAKLQDDEGRYIWSDSLINGEPDRLLGFPVFMSEYAPSTFTTGLYVGILGDFSFYHIADSLSFEIQRLEELYAATNQVGFIGRLESDGMPVLADAFARVKLA